MRDQLKVVGSGSVDESWGPALRESGLNYSSIQNLEEALKSKADCFLVDARDSQWLEALSKIKSSSGAPILSLVKNSVRREELQQLRTRGAQGYLSESTPAEEVAIRIHAMLHERPKDKKDYRTARRAWFQQEVEFSVFKTVNKAWSTTLSETGIFLRTSLSFPLYTVLHLKFNLLGESRPFECDGVIVRQEVEGDIRGFGVMFQNLKGENVRNLEAFLEIYR
ncbi:MAG: hypothetical protein JWQ35_664 [Bacteriovoracaceae bacterium]|nr:hypothetical protein [Bacteriovoracaceae bacterium]